MDPTPGFKVGTNPVDPRIEVIDTATDTIVESIKTGLGSIPVHVTNQGQILVGQYDFAGKDTEGPFKPTSARLAVYHPETYKLIGETPVGLLPLTVRSSNDGKVGFVANVSTGTVDVIDLDSMSLIRTLVVDAEKRTDKAGHVGAHGLAFIP